MAAAAGAELAEWCDVAVLTAAFRRGIKNSAGTGDAATLTALKKFLPDAAYKKIKDLEFTKAVKE